LLEVGTITDVRPAGPQSVYDADLVVRPRASPYRKPNSWEVNV
jgi:hypothetical protein